MFKMQFHRIQPNNIESFIEIGTDRLTGESAATNGLISKENIFQAGDVTKYERKFCMVVLF
jgi:hypothetical protein